MYSTDGKETSNTFGPSSIKSVAHRNADTLVIQNKGQFRGSEVASMDKWECSEDGKTTTIRRHFSGGQGEFDQTLVFEKE